MKEGESLSLEERVYIFSKIYTSINTYFAGWQSVLEINIDTLFKKYIHKVISTEDRFQFGLLMMSFIANFKNGITKYNDRYILEQYGAPLGFKLMNYDGKWVVKSSLIEQVANYDIITEIDGEDFEKFFQKQSKYISASSEREAKARFTSYTFLFPERFSLKLSDGRTIMIDRSMINILENKYQTEGKWIKDGEIGYIRIPSFAYSDCEQKALEYVEIFKDAKALIIDVRDNDAGSCPQELIKSLMDRPYRFWAESTPASFGLFKSYGQLMEEYGDKMSDAQRLTLNICRLFNQSSLLWPAAYEKPSNTLFKGKLSILVDGSCCSAAEDFIIPFKDNKRATILGEKTMGSTGMAFIYNFGNGISINIATKKPYFPDGSAFDSVGIPVDIGVHPILDELKSGKDAVLSEAIRMISMFVR